MSLRWDKRLKHRVGYYRVRSRLLRPRFARALRETDVFLVGHPKSGNTWVAYLLAILLQRDFDGRVTVSNVGDFVPFVHRSDHSIGRARYGGLPDPRVFRNEYPQYPDLYPRVIYLVRDPRAVLVSLWHMHLAIVDGADEELHVFVDDYLDRKGIFLGWHRGLPRWDRQAAEWTARAEADDGTIVVRYEDLVAQRRGSLERLAAFLELDPDPDLMDAAVERGSFSAMRRNEERHGAESFRGLDPGEERFFRKGKIEGWKEELSPASAERIEREMGPVMRRLGYEPEFAGAAPEPTA